MPDTPTKYKVFIASPGGLQDVRTAFRDVIDEHNQVDAKHRGVEFEPVGWEDTLPGIGRPQAKINEDVKTADYFVMVLHDRWGSPTGTDKEFTSGTEEEFHIACQCVADNAPMREIVPLFRGVSAPQLADPGTQLKRVLKFRKKFEREKKFLYGTFDAVEEFKTILRKLLAKWVREHEATTPPAAVIAGPILSISPDRDTQQPAPSPDEFPTDETEAAIAEAERLADNGQLIEAETIYAKEAIKGDPHTIAAYGHFLCRVGRLSQAIVMYESVGELGRLSGNERWQAIAYGNLGNTYQTRGDLDEAEKMHRKALKINESLGRLEGVAIQYGNLGLICKTRGNLDEAEKMYSKALEIHERLGCFEGIAIAYDNLGNIYQTRGELGEAEKMYLMSLKINKRLHRFKCMAKQYRNLDIIYRTRGDLDEANKMRRKALKIERFGYIEGAARQDGKGTPVMEIRFVKDGHHYSFEYGIDKQDEMIDQIMDMAKRGDYNLNWLDAATLSFYIAQLAATGGGASKL